MEQQLLVELMAGGLVPLLRRGVLTSGKITMAMEDCRWTDVDGVRYTLLSLSSTSVCFSILFFIPFSFSFSFFPNGKVAGIDRRRVTTVGDLRDLGFSGI